MNVGLILLWQENHLFNLLKQAKTFPRSQGRSFEDVLFQATHSITTFPASLYQKEGEDDHKEVRGMHAWRKYKKWKGQKNGLAVCQFLDYCDAMYDFRFDRFGTLLRAYRQSRPKHIKEEGK